MLSAPPKKKKQSIIYINLSVYYIKSFKTFLPLRS